jgi:hypothetical protein
VTDHLGLIGRIDALYRSVVTAPSDWGEAAFADWAGDVGPIEKAEARHVRKALRLAQKLAAHWAEEGSAGSVDATDWRGRVDWVLGAQAWRPTLEIGGIGLDVAPSPELFDDVRARFRLVHSELWMAGVGYEEWAASRA